MAYSNDWSESAKLSFRAPVEHDHPVLFFILPGAPAFPPFDALYSFRKCARKRKEVVPINGRIVLRTPLDGEKKEQPGA
jgi:hypothetical protein